jgi:uncharacterized membrane protein
MRYFALFLLAVGLPALALAAGPTYTVVDLGTSPGLEWAPAQPMVANSAAKIGSLGGGITYVYQQTSDASVGTSALADQGCQGGDLFHAFLFVNGKMQDLLGFPPECESAALSLNASHVVVGWSQMGIGLSDIDAQGGIHTAFVWRNGTMQALPSLLQPVSDFQEGLNTSFAYGINNAGEIVGQTAQLLTTGDIAHRAVVWESGAAAKPLELQFQLGKLSHTLIFTTATAINCQGDIAVTGYPQSHGPGDVHAYLLVRQGTQRTCPE